MHKRSVAFTSLLAASLATTLWAADWPTYKADAARSGITAEKLTFPLAPAWVYEPNQAPQPAWPEPGKELHRMDFDYALQPVAAAGFVYFASAADDTLRALMAGTGELAWRFTANGPIRFAPTIARGKAYVAADDGYLYCLDAKTGELVWRFQAAPDDDQLIGNGRLVSRWPCRSGALVLDDVVYVTAGMWPTEGVYVYALDAETGREVWCNDSSGDIYVDLPHPGASGFSGVAPQGYLLVEGDRLLVATGRCVPAAFDRHTGRLLYFKPADALYHGGAWITSGGGLYFNPKNRFQNPSQAFVGEAQPVAGDGMFAYSFASGDVEFTLNGKYRVLATDDTLFAVGGGSVEAIKLDAARERGRVTSDDTRWTTPHTPRVYCLAMAGQTLLAGNDGSISALDAGSGKPLWEAEVEGQVRGLAISDGRLIASTHGGRLLCFERKPAADAEPSMVREPTTEMPLSAEEKQTAALVVQQSGKSRGYAMVIGERDSRLAAAMAAQTELRVINVLPGDADESAERERLLTAGLYGSRVWTERPEDLATLPHAPYFADLVVVSREVEGVSPKECYRVLRPIGGTLCFVGIDEAQREAFIRDADIPPGEVAATGGMVVRGKLPGAGEWRYPWADGGRSGVSKESRVRLPLELIWFGGPGPDRLMDRHLMTSPPVSANGLVFMTGQHDVIAFDAYNGRELWSHHMPKVGRKYAQYYSSGLVADEDSVYVVHTDRCHRLDQETGETLSVYEIPQSAIQGTPPPAVAEYMNVEWPRTWQVIGPFPKGKPPLSPEDLKTVPGRVTVNGEEHFAVSLKAVNQTIDFANLYGGYGLQRLGPGEEPTTSPRRASRPDLQQAEKIAYAFAAITCPQDGKLLIGAGADWWMQWYLDGEPVFDTLDGGNEPPRSNYFSPAACSPRDYIFEADVTAGQHVLAVMVKSGSGGWALASASMADQADEILSVVEDDENLPDLRNLVWGYVSAVDDLVLGTYNVPIAPGQSAESHLVWRSESKAVFALNKSDGSPRWVYLPRPDRTVSNIEIAFGDGRLFLLEATSKADSIQARRRGEQLDIKLDLVALNLADGTELWRQTDVPALGDRSMPTRIKSNPSHLFMGLPNWGHLVYANGTVVLGANAAYKAETGEKLWQTDIRPQKLPIVLGNWLLTQPFAYDLRTAEQRTAEDALTGEQIPWRFPRAYGCGPFNGGQNLLFFRSGADGFFDTLVEGTTNFGGIRPGCARSIIAAHGLLIHPEGYSGCCCSYNYQTSLALAPASKPTDTWYVFPQGASSGPIKRIAVNFGAPGDQRDSNGTAWLGFPRPMLATACPAPVTVLMDNASCYYHRRASRSVQGTDAPWVYSSGLRGSGRIAIGLAVEPNVIIPDGDEPPTIDGELADGCWAEASSIPFENTPFTILGASVDLRVFHDGSNLYFGYHRKPISNPSEGADEALLAESDEFQIYLTDARRKEGIHIAIRRSGGGVAQFGTVDRYRKVDPTWQGAWQHAVRGTEAEWTAEVAVPLRTLTDSALDPKRLALNCMSKNLTDSGLEAIFLIDPSYGADFKRCVRFRGVAASAPAPSLERAFAVRLHFSEADGAEPGQRVFDVAIQGQTVLTDLDIVREANGDRTPLTKEFRGIRGTDQIGIDLIPKGDANTRLDPLISGVEIVEEG